MPQGTEGLLVVVLLALAPVLALPLPDQVAHVLPLEGPEQALTKTT